MKFVFLYLDIPSPAMLRWLSLALVLATNVAAFTDSPSPKYTEPSDAPSQCHARAWVRAPDMVPGEVITGDVKVKLSGLCTGAESYTLGLRFKEKVFWKLRREDAPIPKQPRWTYSNLMASNSDLFRVGPFQNPRPGLDYNETEWSAYENSIQNRDLWSIHEEERIAFEIKNPLAGVEGTDPLSRNFTTQFGILVPNTNYPPGIDCRLGLTPDGGETDIIFSESIYEYFVEIGFSNGTTSEIPAGMTAFTPFYLPTENHTPSVVNVSLSPIPTHCGSNMKPSVDRLRSNYTIEVHFSEGAHVYQNSSVNFTAIVHRTGYTNRTDIPVELCTSSANGIGWHSQELQNRQSFPPFMKALSPYVHMQHQFSSVAYPVPHFPCKGINFAASPAHLPHESHISSASSEPLSLSLRIEHDAVSDFSMYYQKLGHIVKLNLQIKLDPSEPICETDFEKIQREKQIADADEIDWVPWAPRAPRVPMRSTHQILSGDTNILSVIPTQKQGAMRSTLVHYLSDKARQPVFVDSSDIADLRLMLPAERDLIAPHTQPSIKVFAKGEELPRRYSNANNMQYPIYVGDTWVKKVLPMAAEGQRERDIVDHSLVVQG
ncbi:hypothetical protein CY34DRAFT_802892 [Suillus luteus UH-Slu-Lm8-n1]|uniref:Arrestin-like N-terminal domain-containing protein n=1 Tax=Suillus luteus UH-Slu-Lm8-n1 TaxID=930992 RepID=A0A0D0BD59_9AGAM|nr:hypothetical protein CY34DRAFT_802892 [Suillus luteus UH-Slu-Lm8-n1]